MMFESTAPGSISLGLREKNTFVCFCLFRLDLVQGDVAKGPVWVSRGSSGLRWLPVSILGCNVRSPHSRSGLVGPLGMQRQSDVVSVLTPLSGRRQSR